MLQKYTQPKSTADAPEDEPMAWVDTGGYRRVFDAELASEILQYTRLGLSLETVAKLVKVKTEDLDKWLENESFASDFYQAQANLALKAATSLQRIGTANMTATLVSVCLTVMSAASGDDLERLSKEISVIIEDWGDNGEEVA